MSGIDRRIKRNKLKKQMGNNKICDYFHTQYDTLEKRLKRGMEEILNGKNYK